MFALHNIRGRLGKVAAIPDKIDLGIDAHNNCLKAFLEYKGDFNWGKQRDCFFNCSYSLVNRTKQKFKGIDLTYMELSDGVKQIIESEELPEVIGASSKEDAEGYLKISKTWSDVRRED